MTIVFNKKGWRKHGEGAGLWYGSDTEYELYLSDRLMGFEIYEYKLEPNWLALFKNKVVSRHKTKKAAVAACKRHQRNYDGKPKRTRKRQPARKRAG